MSEKLPVNVVVPWCNHQRAVVSIGPTTDQRNHTCPDCGAFWASHPESANDQLLRDLRTTTDTLVRRAEAAEAHIEAQAAEIAGWQRSFAGHVYVKDSDYEALVDAARVGLAFRAIARRDYHGKYASEFIEHVTQRAATLDYASARDADAIVDAMRGGAE